MEYGLGSAGGGNTALDQLTKIHVAIGSSLHMSTKKTTALIEAQVKRGVPRERALGAAVGSSTRWNDKLATVRRNNILGSDLVSVQEEFDAGGATRTSVADDEEESAVTDGDNSGDDEVKVPVAVGAGTLKLPDTVGIALSLQLEGSLRATEKATAILESSRVVTADTAFVIAHKLHNSFRNTTFKVPRSGAARGKSRKFDKMRWTEALDPIKKLRAIMEEQLGKRIVNRIPDKALLITMKMNPTLDPTKLLSEHELKELESVYASEFRIAREQFPTPKGRQLVLLRRKSAGARAKTLTLMTNLRTSAPTQRRG